MPDEPTPSVTRPAGSARATAILTLVHDIAEVPGGLSASVDVCLVDADTLSPQALAQGLAEIVPAGGVASQSFGVIGASNDSLIVAGQAGVSYVVDTGFGDPGYLADLASGGVMVILGSSETATGDDRGDGSPHSGDPGRMSRLHALLDAGAPPSWVVLELPIGSGRSAAAEHARSLGASIGVAAVGPGPRPTLDATAIGSDDAERGRTIGLLAADLIAGVVTVRTPDPHAARRVRAIVAHLVGAAVGEGEVGLVGGQEPAVSTSIPVAATRLVGP